MIEAICNSLTKKIIKSVDGYDENKADEINFGLQLLIGEVPKFFITFILAWILNIIDLTIISFIVIHIECFLGDFIYEHILVAL